MRKLLAGTLILTLLGVSPALASPGPDPALTPTDAVRRALRHNLGLAYDRMAPELTSAPRTLAAAGFDTTLYAGLSLSGSAERQPGSGSAVAPLGASLDATFGLKRLLVTGTQVNLAVEGTLGVDPGDGASRPLGYGAQAALTLTHPLLRGAGVAVNRTAITVAELAQDEAKAGLLRKAELVAAETLKAYWDLHAALAAVRIRQVAMKTSEENLGETLELIKAGKQAPVEEVSARHNVKTDERALLLARQAVQNARDKLARLIGEQKPADLTTPGFTTRAGGGLPDPGNDLAGLFRTATEKRGDLRALAVATRGKQVEARAADNGKLLKLDLTGSAVTGVTRDRLATGTTVTAGGAVPSVTLTVGIRVEFEVGRREANARAELADLAVRRAALAWEQRSQVVSEELKVAHRAVRSAEALVALNQASVKVAEIKLTNERDKYRAGKSTARMVALVQADLIQEQLALEQAHATLHQALVDLWSTTGTLLERLGTVG